MTRRGNNEDSICKDGDRWRGAISLGFDASGKRVRKKVSGETRAEVVEKLRKLREQLAKGRPLPDERLTVGAFLDRWITTVVPGRVSSVTLDGYEDMVRLHLKPALGRTKLTKLTVNQVDALWTAKSEEGYAANSVRSMRAVLRKALNRAEVEGLVWQNVAALSEPLKSDSDEGRTLTVDESRRLLDMVATHHLNVAVALSLIYGLRRGEALGLMWANFDPKQRDATADARGQTGQDAPR